MGFSEVAVADIRALVLDDNRNFQNLLRMLLRQLGFRRIELFGEPSEAERQVREHAFDLAFVDYSMPKVNGIDWVRSVHQSGGPANPDMATVMVTGHGGRKLVEEAVAAGIDGFLLKPLSSERLERHVATVLGRRREVLARRDRGIRPPPRPTVVIKAPPPVTVPEPVSVKVSKPASLPPSLDPEVVANRRREPQRTVRGIGATIRTVADASPTFLD
jgi:DNA-binding NarL/FixJ family response regulator